MKRLFSYVVLVSLTAFTGTSELPVVAGGCSSSKEKTEEIKCDKNDSECQIKKTEMFDINEVIKS